MVGECYDVTTPGGFTGDLVIARAVKPARRQLPTLLSPAQKRLLALALVLAGFMLADTLYLLLVRLADHIELDPFALGAASLPDFYQALLLAHTGAGLLLAALMAAFLVWHLPAVWRRYHSKAAWTGVPYAALGIALTVTGFFIFSAAASEENSWAWWLHTGASVLAVAGYAAHRSVSHTRPPAVRFARFLGPPPLRAWRSLSYMGPARWAAAAHLGGSSGAREQKAPVGSTATPKRCYGGTSDLPGGCPPERCRPRARSSPRRRRPRPADSSRRASSRKRIRTCGSEAIRAEAGARSFVQEARIGIEGCERCHSAIADQWATSAHRFASFNNPFYEATIVAMRSEALEPNRWIERHLVSPGTATDGVGRAKSKWCSGCHDPVLLFAGSMGQEIDRSSVEAQAGLTCLSCHAISRIHDRTGNGNYNIGDDSADPYVFASSPPGSVGRFLHDAALKARPEVHTARMLKPFFRQSTYCATCHKVGLTEPVNGYRWLRGQDDFDSWDDSGVSLNAARTFYLPTARRVCQDCHMPPEPAPQGDLAAENGMVRSHRFLAANTALPFLRGDTATQRRIEDFLQAEKLRIDIFAVRVPDPRSLLVLAPRGSSVPAGVPVTFDIVVRNLGVGHAFPGGTNDSNEGWIEFTVTDSVGRRVLASGLVGADGHLDPMAHTFKAVLVDRNGNAIHRRNAQDIHTTVYANVIGPGTADLAHYELTLPAAFAGATLTVSARLLWRKFDRAYSDFAFETNPAGFRDFDSPPELPVTEIAADSVRVLVTAPGTRGMGAPVEDASDWIHNNDYGIALLMEGDLRRAAQAFARVEALAPGRIDGPLNLARTAFAEGNLVLAYAALERSEAIDAGNPRAAWVWGQVLQEEGRYEDAVLAYRRVLEAFPGDRAAWTALGRTLFLDGRYQDALGALARVLEIDPEDRIAHYHRMLSLRALGRAEEAARAEAAYLFYGIDEAAQEITRAYRARDPGANIMAQPIPVHRLEVIR